MPHPHLPGPRPAFKDSAITTLVEHDPDLLLLGHRGDPNYSAIARKLNMIPATLARVRSGQLPPNLEMVVAYVAKRGTWDAAADLVEILDEDGQVVELGRPCRCERVAA
jgi:hypothetical protein